jgi:DNA invertase Pin-like site-specific DNA recombinase
MKSAFGYCRVSSVGQSADDRDGIPRQKEAIKKYAAAHDLRIVRWFIANISGTSDLDHRPALQELIAAANGVRTIVIERLDRVARDLMLQESIITDFKRNGFELISTCEPDLCSADPSRVLMRQIMGSFAEYERKMLTQKLQGARARARVKRPDYREGRKTFGQRAGEQDTIKRVMELHQSGANLSVIARTLAQEGRKTRTGGGWYAKTVSDIIKRAS